MPAPLLIHGVTAVDASGAVPDAWLLADHGVIRDRGQGATRPTVAGATVIDGAGGFLTPGFLDIHRHGGGGHAHEDGPGGILGSLRAHHAHGSTRAVASLVAGPVSLLADSLRAIAEVAAAEPLLLGSHLEGPFLAVERKGAHDARFLVDPASDAVDALLAAAAGTLRQVTLDPRRAGAAEATRRFLDAGAAVAVGHTEATYEEAMAAFDAGASILTHAFNAMPGIHHRAPGPVVAALDAGHVALELILDGEHVHPRVAAMLFAEAPGRVVLVTDAMAAAGAGDGDHVLGGLAVEVRGGRALLAGTSTLAGSTLTQDQALRVGLAAGIPAPALVEALTLAPARALGLDDRLGRLAPGYAADLVVLDADWQVSSVHAEGRRLA